VLADSANVAALVAPVERGSRPAAPAAEASPAAAAVPARAPEVREQAPQIAKARALAVTKTAPSRRLQAGDSICGNCGEGNAPSRKFCSRCGDSLVAAEQVKPRWWHRFRRTRGPRTVKLGDESGKAGSGGNLAAHRFDLRHLLTQIYRKGRIVVAVIVVIAGVIYGAYPPFRTKVNSLVTSEKTKVAGIVDQHFVPIHPLKCTDNGHDAAHPASLACDGFFNNYWLAHWQPAPEPSITMTFAHPVTLKKMILYNGAFGHYVANGRPSSLHLVFSNQESFTITPEDTPQPQTFSIGNAVLIKSVEIQITSTYQGQGNGASNVAISQIELFGIG
jgi:hypothetical protein